MRKILVQPDICDGCLDCEKACAELYGIPRIMIKENDGSYYPVICQQCEDAPCKKICRKEAIEEEIDEDKCKGCGLCITACPFGSVQLHEKKAYKCNQCPDLDTPACIKACSKRAIAMVDPQKLMFENQQRYIDKLSGPGKKEKHTGFINLLTLKTRARDTLYQEEVK